ncbi:hypothetical protein QAD02_007509 [Eretmocerus hayati]|uniref:Uncharacterized protein n=1 Tax=Eretmocerus hayati TaxID=131215 RepID=A0ACC2N6A5_9HYME|nr:hypothetical protein QAD02_007509 [Eretmocerus hayati]
MGVDSEIPDELIARRKEITSSKKVQKGKNDKIVEEAEQQCFKRNSIFSDDSDVDNQGTHNVEIGDDKEDEEEVRGEAVIIDDTDDNDPVPKRRLHKKKRLKFDNDCHFCIEYPAASKAVGGESERIAQATKPKIVHTGMLINKIDLEKFRKSKPHTSNSVDPDAIALTAKKSQHSNLEDKSKKGREELNSIHVLSHLEHPQKTVPDREPDMRKFSHNSAEIEGEVGKFQIQSKTNSSLRGSNTALQAVNITNTSPNGDQHENDHQNLHKKHKKHHKKSKLHKKDKEKSKKDKKGKERSRSSSSERSRNSGERNDEREKKRSKSPSFDGRKYDHKRQDMENEERRERSRSSSSDGSRVDYKKNKYGSR